MAILTSSRRLLAQCAVVLGCAVIMGGHAVAQAMPGALEYQVKAAYLLNFTRYVDWPPSVFADTDAPLTLCVVGRDPFGEVLERTIAGRHTAGRPLRILRPDRPAGDVCHVTFFGETTPPTREAWIAALEHEPTLTVGDGGDFARSGGMIGFVIRGETVRFEINVEAVRSAGLQISSRVLTLATRLYEREGS
jgi:hypothetical protein